MVADVDRIARQAEDVARAERPGAQEIRGETQPVPVADGELDGRLDPGLRHEPDPGERRHVRARDRVVRQVHRVDVPDEPAGVLGDWHRGRALRRHDLAGDGEGALPQEGGQAPRRSRHGRP